MKKFTLIVLFFFMVTSVFSQARLGITSSIDWTSMLLSAEVTLDLESAGLRLPTGRTQGESILNAGYFNLIRPGITAIQADSSSTIADLISRGEFSAADVDMLASQADSIPPAIRSDMRQMFASWTISLSSVSSPLLRRSSPAPIVRTLNPVSSPAYTGIIVIASESLPIHGMRRSTLPVPCLFPKIWDSDMNLIYDRSMLDLNINTMVRYSTLQNIFANNPSGLSDQLRQTVGDRPLRIFARGVFGIKPTDLIIERSDALLIISSEENRRLLSQGKVVFILDESVLRISFND